MTTSILKNGEIQEEMSAIHAIMKYVMVTYAQDYWNMKQNGDHP